MANFFKSFGKGILYLLVLPFLLVILAVYGVVGLFVFLFMAIKGLILFFTGRSLFDDLPEDKKAKEIIAAQARPTAQMTLAATSEEDEEENTHGIDKSLYTNSEPEVDQTEDPFYVPEYLKNTPEVEEPQEEQPIEENIDEEESLLYKPKGYEDVSQFDDGDEEEGEEIDNSFERDDSIDNFRH